MSKRSTLLAALPAALLVALPAIASAQLALTTTFDIAADGADPDPNGFNGSTWSITYTTDQTTYEDFGGNASFTVDTVDITVSGAGNAAYNGTFNDVPEIGGGIFRINGFGGSGFGDVPTNRPQINFGPDDLDVLLIGVVTELPGVTFTPGAPILASDWNGRSLDFGELEGDFGGGFDVVDIENWVVTA
ncbi:MAG: hypothetical protein AAF743_09610, partial [Planctomycetota bacterium]